MSSRQRRRIPSGLVGLPACGGQDDSTCDLPSVPWQDTVTVTEDEYFAVGGLESGTVSEGGCHTLREDALADDHGPIAEWIECRYEGKTDEGREISCDLRTEASCVQ